MVWTSFDSAIFSWILNILISFFSSLYPWRLTCIWFSIINLLIRLQKAKKQQQQQQQVLSKDEKRQHFIKSMKKRVSEFLPPKMALNASGL